MKRIRLSRIIRSRCRGSGNIRRGWMCRLLFSPYPCFVQGVIYNENADKQNKSFRSSE